MMKQKTIIGIIIFMVIIIGGIVTADLLANRKVIIPITQERYKGNATFVYNKSTYNCSINNVKENIELDDIYICAMHLGIDEGEELSDICDWNGNCLKEGEDTISFSINP